MFPDLVVNSVANVDSFSMATRTWRGIEHRVNRYREERVTVQAPRILKMKVEMLFQVWGALEFHGGMDTAFRHRSRRRERWLRRTFSAIQSLRTQTVYAVVLSFGSNSTSKAKINLLKLLLEC